HPKPRTASNTAPASLTYPVGMPDRRGEKFTRSGSQRSPTPSPSTSAWSPFATAGQSSRSSPTPSPSVSGAAAVTTTWFHTVLPPGPPICTVRRPSLTCTTALFSTNSPAAVTVPSITVVPSTITRCGPCVQHASPTDTSTSYVPFARVTSQVRG